MTGCDWEMKRFKVAVGTPLKTNPKAMNWDKVFNKNKRSKGKSIR